MKIRIRNLGVIRDAEFELADLTVLCGKNNTGKTYANYALYGFLRNLKSIIFQIRGKAVSDKAVESLMNNGTAEIDVKKRVEEINNMLREACSMYTLELPRIFASSTDKFHNAEFSVQISENDIPAARELGRSVLIGKSILSVYKGEEDETAKISLTLEKEDEPRIDQTFIGRVLSRIKAEILFDSVFPRAFIASAERTGAAIFAKELDFARNRLLEKRKSSGMTAEDFGELLDKAYQDYPLPITDEVDFTRVIGRTTKEKSFLAENHRDVLNDFADIVGGSYVVNKNQDVSYRPKGKRPVTLNMSESSSSVRSLLDISFYLHHIAQRGDLLMIDEPEMNLHPENQRQIARLLACLANLGIKVFITTHSDYIVKEFNTLILLNRDKAYLKKIAEEEGFRKNQLLSSEKIRVYVAAKALIMLEGNKRRSRHNTILQAEIAQEKGIDAFSFDETIDKMNEIDEAILWGSD